MTAPPTHKGEKLPPEPRLVSFDHHGREYVELDIAPNPAATPMKRAKRKPKTFRTDSER